MQVVAQHRPIGDQVFDPDEFDNYREKDRCEFCLGCGNGLTLEEWELESSHCFKCINSNDGVLLEEQTQEM